MAKEQFGRSKACATKTIYAVMKEIVRSGGCAVSWFSKEDAKDSSKGD